MYEFMKGILIEKTPTKAVVEIQGIAYRLSIGLNTYTRLPAHQSPIQFFLSQVVREDSHTLYAFLLPEERNLFEILITISGIGPKTALGIVGNMQLEVFERAIATADTGLISKIPGIGKKTAERLVIEMKDKLKHFKSAPSSSFGGLMGDAISALLHLGYNPVVAQKAVEGVLKEAKEEKDLGKIITSALQKI